jgi:hypothetical protein
MKFYLSVIAVLAASLGAAAQSPISIRPATSISLRSGVYPRDIAVADFNHDGRPDIAVAELMADTVAILLQRGNGSFSNRADARAHFVEPAWVLALPLDNLNTAAPVADDLVVRSEMQHYTSLLNQHTPQGTLAVANTNSNYAGGWQIRPTVGKYNAGTAPDIAQFSSGSTSGIAWLENMGNGVLQTQFFGVTIAGSMSAATTADLNGDGLEEAIVILNQSLLNLQVYENTSASAGSTGWWRTSSASRFNIDQGTVSVAAADVDGDGLVDLALAHGIVAPGRVYRDIGIQRLVRNNVPGGNGIFEFAQSTLTYPLISSPKEVLLADLTGDHRPEIIALCVDGTLNILENTGGAGAALYNAIPYSYPTGPDPTALRVADMDGDGDLDVVLACTGDDTVRIYYNESTVLSASSALNVPKLDVYPNPASASFQLTGMDKLDLTAPLELLDLTGRVVRRWEESQARGPLSVSELPRGVFILRLPTKTGSASRRVILR